MLTKRKKKQKRKTHDDNKLCVCKLFSGRVTIYNYVINNPLLHLDPNGMVWVNAYFEQLVKELIVNPKNINWNKVDRLAQMGNKTQQVINDFKKENEQLYDYVDKLQVTKESVDSDGNLTKVQENVVVRVGLSDDDKGTDGQYAETSAGLVSSSLFTYNGETFNIPIPILNPNTNIVGKSLVDVFQKREVGTVGFNIILFRAGLNTISLANEVGDVMFLMEYNEFADKEIGTNKSYRNKWSSKYSDMVEHTHKLIQKGVLANGSLYPLLFESGNIFTKKGDKIPKR